MPPDRSRLSTEWARGITDDIADLTDDPGHRSALRPAARKHPDEAHSAHRYLATYTDGLDEATTRAVYTVAGLIATYPTETLFPDINLGAAFAHMEIIDGVRPSRDKATPAERRVMHLSRCDLVTLARQLYSALGLLHRTRSLPDWALLLDDLSSWTKRRDAVGSRWLRSYHRTHRDTTNREQDSTT